MLVRCVRNALKEIPESSLTEDVRRSFGSYQVHHLTKGKDYVVYARVLRPGDEWVFIADDVFSSYPMAYPIILFERIDSRISRGWQFGKIGDSPGEAFPEWIQDISFYDKLLDGDPVLIDAFGAIKKRMDLEFPVLSAIQGNAIMVGANVAMCPICDASWLVPGSNRDDSMFECENCHRLLLNPGPSQEKGGGTPTQT